MAREEILYMGVATTSFSSPSESSLSPDKGSYAAGSRTGREVEGRLNIVEEPVMFESD